MLAEPSTGALHLGIVKARSSQSDETKRKTGTTRALYHGKIRWDKGFPLRGLVVPLKDSQFGHRNAERIVVPNDEKMVPL